MGFYDCRCMVTGVSLKGAGAALVLLQDSAGEYCPISLAIKGNYNRLGSIDEIEEDANARLVLKFFLDGLPLGTFTVDEEALAREECFPIRTSEDLLQGFERNINDGPGYAALNGQPVVFALIARAVWDTIAQHASPSDESAPIVFQRLFAVSSVGAQIYAGALGEVCTHVGESAAFDALLKERRLPWKPAEDPGQDYPEEMRQYLGAARQTFADSAIIMEALRRYEVEVGDLLKDE